MRVESKQLYINGRAVDDDEYTVHQDPRVERRATTVRGMMRGRDNFGPFTVPDDSYFCMGDNRDRSYDSRFWKFVDESEIKGLAFIKYWSWDREEFWPRWDRIGRPID